jgi:uncharacterized membrane protein YgaE (UPF0421/DUF939 family)
VINTVLRVSKAVAAAIGAFASSLALALPDGVTTSEWVQVAVTTAVTAVTVWAAPANRPADADPPRA